uniref:glutathione peroxidase n=1 Tax=Ditylenchus dipsaci TaxID=166011 RepID=A0A915DYL5_9BILA
MTFRSRWPNCFVKSILHTKMNRLCCCLFLAALFALTVAKKEKETPGPKLMMRRPDGVNASPKPVYLRLPSRDFGGEFTDLSQYKGQVLLVINVATFVVTYTQQYTDFNPLIEKNRENGKEFTILGFPCNNSTCKNQLRTMNFERYCTCSTRQRMAPHRNLHIYGKLEVNGQNHHPMYEFLKDSCPQTVVQIGKGEELMYNPIRTNDITWNFEVVFASLTFFTHFTHIVTEILVDKKGRPRSASIQLPGATVKLSSLTSRSC